MQVYQENQLRLDSMLDVHAEGNISDGSAFFVITNNMINVGNKMADTLNIHMTPKTSDIQNSNDQYIDTISRSKPLSSQTTRQFTNPMISHNSRHSSQRIDNSFQDLARQHSQERISTNERLSRKKKPQNCLTHSRIQQKCRIKRYPPPFFLALNILQLFLCSKKNYNLFMLFNINDN